MMYYVKCTKVKKKEWKIYAYITKKPLPAAGITFVSAKVIKTICRSSQQISLFRFSKMKTFNALLLLLFPFKAIALWEPFLLF